MPEVEQRRAKGKGLLVSKDIVFHKHPPAVACLGETLPNIVSL